MSLLQVTSSGVFRWRHLFSGSLGWSAPPGCIVSTEKLSSRKRVEHRWSGSLETASFADIFPSTWKRWWSLRRHPKIISASAHDGAGACQWTLITLGPRPANCKVDKSKWLESHFLSSGLWLILSEHRQGCVEMLVCTETDIRGNGLSYFREVTWCYPCWCKYRKSLYFVYKSLCNLKVYISMFSEFCGFFLERQ